MAKIIKNPSKIHSVGSKPKIIEEFVGAVNTKNNDISIAYMKSPKGWIEPGQTPNFDEYTLVLKGQLLVENNKGDIIEVNEGQAISTYRNEWVRYSTPNMDTEYIAVCIPAFSIDLVNRDR